MLYFKICVSCLFFYQFSCGCEIKNVECKILFKKWLCFFICLFDSLLICLFDC